MLFSDRLKGKKVLVIGLGISGLSAALFLQKQHSFVHAVDKSIEALKNKDEVIALCQNGMTIASDDETLDLSGFDLVVVSPGIPKSHHLYAGAKAAGIEVIGEIELGCRSALQPMIGITGTNGKTTVTLLVAHVLNFAGKKARPIGNVGIPLTREIALSNLDEILVAELSSYQLETLTCKVFDAGAILNITPDHLDRYKGMQEYAEAKFHLKDCLKNGAPLYIEEKAMKEFGTLLKGFSAKTYGYGIDCSTKTDLASLSVDASKCPLPASLQGFCSHDLENVMAASSICMHFGVSLQDFFKAYRTFKKPSHRIEFVCSINGISYYDDSKGTNIDAVVRAVERMQGSVVLIAGGVDKGAAYTPWISAFQNKVDHICAIGQAAEKIKDQLGSAMPVHVCTTLEEAVKCAAYLAKPGQSVLLSPGCSSFDMFRDYVHRGEQFQSFVRQLI